MSTTHFVNSPNDITVFVRLIPNGKGEKEWVLKLVSIDLNTLQVVVIERVLSDVFTDLKVVHDATNNGYLVTIADRTSEPTGNGHYTKLTSGSEDIYDFTDYTDASSGGKKCRMIIEDVTMSVNSTGGITDTYVTIKIVSGGMANPYTHHLWHNVSNA